MRDWIRRLLLLLHGRRQRLSAHLSIVPILNRQLDETAKDVEQSVVGVCGNFQNIAERARESVRQTAQVLEGERGGGVDEIIETSRTTLAHLLERMERGGEVSRTAVQQMHRMDTAMKRVVRVLNDIERIAFSNRLLALNAKIQAVHVGVAGAGFGVVADEISEQARRSNQLTDEISGILRVLESGINQAITSLSEIAILDRAHTEVSRAEVERALKALEGKNAEMRQCLRKAAEEGERLAADVFQAVVTLQFQDRVNQRIQHVIGALNDMHDLSAESNSPGRDSSANEEVKRALANRYTMDSERLVAGDAETSTGQDDIELF